MNIEETEAIQVGTKEAVAGHLKQDDKKEITAGVKEAFAEWLATHHEEIIDAIARHAVQATAEEFQHRPRTERKRPQSRPQPRRVLYRHPSVVQPNRKRWFKTDDQKS